MKLAPLAVERYRLETETDPPNAPASEFEASFDEGGSWHDSTPVVDQVHGELATWLVARVGADLTGLAEQPVAVISEDLLPRIRHKDDPVSKVRFGPAIRLVDR